MQQQPAHGFYWEHTKTQQRGLPGALVFTYSEYTLLKSDYVTSLYHFLLPVATGMLHHFWCFSDSAWIVSLSHHGWDVTLLFSQQSTAQIDWRQKWEEVMSVSGRHHGLVVKVCFDSCDYKSFLSRESIFSCLNKTFAYANSNPFWHKIKAIVSIIFKGHEYAIKDDQTIRNIQQVKKRADNTLDFLLFPFLRKTLTINAYYW